MHKQRRRKDIMGNKLLTLLLSDVWTYVIFLPFIGAEFQQTSYGVHFGSNTRLTSTPSLSVSVASPANCAVTCYIHNSTKGFNVRYVSADSSLLCECYTAASYDVSRTLAFEKQSTYFESTCLASTLYVRAANSGTATADEFIVELNHGTGDELYPLKISKTLDSHTIMTSTGRVDTFTSGKFNVISSMFNSVYQGKRYDWFIENDSVTCFNAETSPSTLCTGPYPIHFKNILKGWDSSMTFDAFVPTDDTLTSVFAFGNTYVYVIKLSTLTEWELVSKELIFNNNIWKGAPNGIIAAAWIGRNGRSLLDTSMAVLFTRDYFVVYRMSDKTIVYRGQLCET